MDAMRGLPEARRTRLEDLVAAGSVVSAGGAAAAAATAPAPVRAEEVSRASVFPVLSAMAGLLPDGGLRGGGVYAVEGSVLLAVALASAVSGEGRWSAVVGIPALGAEAAVQLGGRLDRIVVVPAPGRSWATVVGTLAEAVSVIVTAPPADVSSAEVQRVEARLRQQGSALVVLGAWPRPEARLRVVRSEWLGIGRGHGHLAQHRVLIASVARRDPGRERSVELLLPEGAPIASVARIGAAS